MRKVFYFKVSVLLAIGVVFLATGCGLMKKTTAESSSQPQDEIKQEAVAPPQQEEVKPAPATEAKEAKPVTEGEQKVAAAQTLNELGDIHFDFDKYTLQPEDRTILNSHANWLLKNTEYRVTIEGNCDERGTEEYNMALGQRRADTARQYLIDMGVDGKRISTISYGKDRPLDPAHNEAAWAKNRNDHFVLDK